MQRTNLKEMEKNAKKRNMVKIENHCTKKIRLGHLCIGLTNCIKSIKHVGGGRGLIGATIRNLPVGNIFRLRGKLC